MTLLIKTLLFVIIIVVYVFAVRKIFDLIFKLKKNVGTKFLRSIVMIFGLAILIFSYLFQFESLKDVNKILLQCSSLVLAVATFSCQQVLGNVISGVTISLVKPFDLGDKICIMSGGSKVCEGTVIDMNIRHVTIKMVDGRCSLIPNHLLDDMIVINNHTLEDMHGYPLEIECTYDSDVDKAMQLMRECINENELTINKQLSMDKVTCSNLSANGFVLKAVIWTSDLNDNFIACSQLRIAIYKKWRKNGISMPYQTITLANAENK